MNDSNLTISGLTMNSVEAEAIDSCFTAGHYQVSVRGRYIATNADDTILVEYYYGGVQFFGKFRRDRIKID